MEMSKAIEVLEHTGKAAAKIEDKIKKNERYHVWRAGSKNPDMTITGDQLTKHFQVDKWSDFLNIGYLPAGYTYNICRITGGPDDMVKIFSGASQNLQFMGGGMQDNVSQGNQQTMPIPMIQKSNVATGKTHDWMSKTMADTIQATQMTGMGALQEALQGAQDQVMAMSSECSALRQEYEQELKKMRYEMNEKEKLIARLEGTIETLNRDIENERWKNQFKEEMRLEQERFYEESADPMDKLVGLVDRLAPLAGTFSQMKKPNLPDGMQMITPDQMRGLQQQQQQQQQNYQQQKMDNVDYQEVDNG